MLVWLLQHIRYYSQNKKQLIVSNKKWRHKIQMTNDRPLYILPLVDYNVYWPIIGHLYCTTSFFIRHCKLVLERYFDAYFIWFVDSRVIHPKTERKIIKIQFLAKKIFIAFKTDVKWLGKIFGAPDWYRI